MHTVRTMMTGRRGSAAAALRAAIVTGFGLLACACQTDQKTTAAPDVPYDYRLRHPITITEAERTLQLFIGANRGELTAQQRAELLAFAQNWKQEATGGVLIDLPAPPTRAQPQRRCAKFNRSWRRPACRRRP
jgi:pilus assembly protein CpaD